jgi:hypothetical protein
MTGQYQAHMLTREDQTTLNDLRWHWSNAYAIAVRDHYCWEARPLDRPGEVLTADDGETLRLLIRDDYASHRQRRSRPYPRAHKPGACWCGERHSLLMAQELNEPGP